MCSFWNVRIFFTFTLENYDVIVIDKRHLKYHCILYNKIVIYCNNKTDIDDYMVIRHIIKSFIDFHCTYVIISFENIVQLDFYILAGAKLLNCLVPIILLLQTNLTLCNNILLNINIDKIYLRTFKKWLPHVVWE